MPKERVELFTSSLGKILTEYHDRYPPQNQLKEIGNLKKTLNRTQIVLRKTDKSKVFHLDELDNYRTKARAYLTQTNAYQDLGEDNPLELLIKRTNDMLFGLWLPSILHRDSI